MKGLATALFFMCCIRGKSTHNFLLLTLCNMGFLLSPFEKGGQGDLYTDIDDFNNLDYMCQHIVIGISKNSKQLGRVPTLHWSRVLFGGLVSALVY
jgi:hypothetical protein